MPKYTWTATVTRPGQFPGRGSGTVEADCPESAKALIQAFVGRPGVRGHAKKIVLTVVK